jgi:hypothetical protein
MVRNLLPPVTAEMERRKAVAVGKQTDDENWFEDTDGCTNEDDYVEKHWSELVKVADEIGLYWDEEQQVYAVRNIGEGKRGEPNAEDESKK